MSFENIRYPARDIKGGTLYGLKIISSSSKIIYICLILLGTVIYIVRVTKVRDNGCSAEKDGNVLGSGNVVLVMLRRVDCGQVFRLNSGYRTSSESNEGKKF